MVLNHTMELAFWNIGQNRPDKALDIKATYAYHLGLSSNKPECGVAAGISISLDYSKLNLENSIDPAITPGFNTKHSPILMQGLAIRS
ncbi:hypothetical protein CS542_05555 [Pedobacter sp. IW39]|nr:hypothetical protein CS542_05555 [Pedobacter sp. IW39]